MEEGGQRCATHLRPDYLKAVATATEKPEFDLREQVRLSSAAVAYATTPSGMRGIEGDIVKFTLAGKTDIAEILKFSLEEGHVQRRATQRREDIILNTQSGQLFAVYMMENAPAIGLPLQVAYEQVGAIATEYVHKFLAEIQSQDVEFIEHCKAFAEAFSRSAIATALDIYSQTATPEQISELLESRSNDLEENFNLSQADFDVAFKELAENSLPDLGKYKGGPQE